MKMEDFERKAKTCMLIMIWISMVSTVNLVKQEKVRLRTSVHRSSIFVSLILFFTAFRYVGTGLPVLNQY